jgi:cyanophycinase-like exopeptidase
MQLNARSIARTALLLVVYGAIAPCRAAAENTAHNYRDESFDYFVAGDPARPRAAHTDYGLALMGGGGAVDAAYRFIANHAGGGHIVVLRAVSDNSFDAEAGDYGESFAGKWGPVVSAETIVFHSRKAAFDARVIAALRNADGIFLAGGDQGNYIRYWKGTPVQQALNAHARANRPIGGSSAGLAILGHFSYTALDGGSMESKIALADPYDAGVTLEDDFLHFRWLESVFTDTHFSTRCRLGRLIVFVARVNQAHPAAKAFGLGIDEKSALLIDAGGLGRLAEGSAGSAWLVMPQRPAVVLSKGQPLTLTDVRIVRLDMGSELDFKSRQIGRPGAESLDSIVRGTPPANSIATPIILRDKVPPNEP